MPLTGSTMKEKEIAAKYGFDLRGLNQETKESLIELITTVEDTIEKAQELEPEDRYQLMKNLSQILKDKIKVTTILLNLSRGFPLEENKKPVIN